MVAQSIASRPRRPQPEPDDAVMARALQAADWVRRNVTLISIVGGLIVVLVVGFLWYRSDRAGREEDAAIAFLPVEQAVLAGDPTVAGRELQLFIQRHDGTMYADEARLLLAQVHLRSNRTAEAIEVVTPVADEIDSPLGPQAALLLAAAQESAGEQDAAVATYLRVAEEADSDFRREEGLVGAARVRELTGDFAGAAELYGRLVEMTEGSDIRTLYEMRRAEVEARAASPTPAAAAPAAPSPATAAPATAAPEGAAPATTQP